ncbi:hypothetical protein CEXT_273041 [Caerostris extrusa]|uniref:Uncharacterized protein n=1 Tax=Caerostris extrusa TaxID=172846 RepID=A0AAV4P1J5_CAEEX|nr:hypothetical protein CEXT_273041 [Caerostris extrusa]
MEQQKTEKSFEGPEVCIKTESSEKNPSVKCEMGCKEGMADLDSKLYGSTVVKIELPQHRELESSNSWKDSISSCQNQQVKKASFAHSVFSTESTDSLDFLSDNQPRLTSSMSCGDLSADTSRSAPKNDLPLLDLTAFLLLKFHRRFVHSGSRSTNRQRLDINQNGWKKNERKKELSTGRGSQQAVVDMKLASKCCMLC